MREHEEKFKEMSLVLQQIEDSRKEYQFQLESFREARKDAYIAPEMENKFIPLLQEVITACLDREAFLQLIISDLPITGEEAEHLLKCPIIKGKFEEIITNSIRNTYSPG